MKREIKFRGKEKCSGLWRCGFLLFDGEKYYIIQTIQGTLVKWIVDTNTIGQFTGLTDKNEKPIYEGDIVEFYEMKTYCINPDCEPHLIGYNDRLYKRTCVVEFKECSFGVDDDYFFTRLSDCGLLKEDIEELKDREENDAYFDTNGYNIDDSIVGIKVIGNIYDNPELMK